MNIEPCPICSHMQPVGTFRTNSIEKPPLLPFRVQTEKDDGTMIHHGDYDSIEMARASACGSSAIILTRDT